MRSTVLALLVAASTIGSAATLGCSSSSSSTSQVSAADARGLLIDRNWMDLMPKDERERLHVYRFVPSMGGGVFQDRTLFKGTFELFSFAVKGETIEFTMHETHDQVTSPFRIETVDGPAPFDLKLIIPGTPRGPKVYFGIRAETDRAGTLLEQRLRN